MRRGQSLVEIALVLPVVVLIMVGSIVWLDASSRFERVSTATSLAARAAATSAADRQAAAQSIARSALAGTFAPEDVHVSVLGEPCAHGDPLTVTTRVEWNLFTIPLYGPVHIDFEAVRKSTCEAY